MCTFNLFKTFAILTLISRSECDHVALVSCAEDADCLSRLDASIVDVIRANLHNATDPCENFWDYACGEWTAAPYYNHVDNFGAVGNYYAQKLQKYLQDASFKGHADTEIMFLLRKVERYYTTCTGVNTYYLKLDNYFKELMNREPRLRWLDDLRISLNGDKWSTEDFDWLSAIADLRRFGFNGVFLHETVNWAYNDSARYVIELRLPYEGESFKNKQEILGAIVELCPDCEQEVKKYEQLATVVYAFETEIQALRKKYENQVVLRRNLMGDGVTQCEDEAILTLGALHAVMPHFGWFQYFSNLLKRTPLPTLPIQLVGLSYMHNLEKLLSKTDAETIAWYILFRLTHLLQQMAPQITPKNCFDHIAALMPLGVDYLFDRYLYETRVADEMTLGRIFTRLKARFSRYLVANKFPLSPLERSYLQDKLSTMNLRLGNLPARMSAAHYNAYYADANLSATNFYHNHLEMLRFRTQQQHANLLIGDGRLCPDTFYVYDDIQTARNAPYFVHQRNLLIVPMIFLHLPFYEHRSHPLLQYSLGGWILAHELSHAFDTSGITFDSLGNENSAGEMILANIGVQRSLRCFMRTPTAALIERIADVSGMQLAYDVYFGGEDGVAERARLAPEFNSQQLFFLNFAQFFCGSLPHPIAHDRDDVRVIETMANMPEFATAFRCAPDTREHPFPQCAFWRV
ncbi:neprilysin-4 [Anastrepha ludens]|uniref:neprilysin-4 n=1 Tax=Anastrepha ludens TaxID=28586 RepID=UPI0023B0A775|nr:neprilysin-4 [Anastrepha ludens]